MLGENLFHLRKIHGFSQEEVAERVGVSRQAVAKWENGVTSPDIENCVALSKLYNVTVDDLITFDSSEADGLTVPPRGKYMFGTVTVGEKGQIVIPVKARRIFGINPGDDLMVLGDIEEGLALVSAERFLAMAEEVNAVLKGKTGDRK